MPSVILIDNYDSFTYNLFQMVQVETKLPVEVFRNDALTLADLVAMKPDRIILSPGPGHPAIDADFGVCKDIIQQWDALQCPVLGVCLGHQGMVQHLGGEVVQAPAIVHGKTSPIEVLKPSPLFEGLSSPFQAMRYHSLVAAETPWPAELEITARDTADHLIMALQHKSKPLYGVQFHPESIGTPEGAYLLRNFVEKC
jgi:anthranilate synthase component II